MVHQAVQGGDHHAVFLFQQAAHDLEPLAGHQVAVDVGAVKEKVPGRVQPDILAETAEIVVDFPGPGLVVGNHQLPGNVRCRFLDQVDLLGIQTPADPHRAVPAL